MEKGKLSRKGEADEERIKEQRIGMARIGAALETLEKIDEREAMGEDLSVEEIADLECKAV